MSNESVIAVYYFPNYHPGDPISGNTPARFHDALAIANKRLRAQKIGPRILTINSWNQWTEGSYIEPDTRQGMKYLEAIRDVFGPKQVSKDARPASEHDHPRALPCGDELPAL